MEKLIKNLENATASDGIEQIVELCHLAGVTLQDLRQQQLNMADAIKALDPDRLGTANQTMTYQHGFSAGVAEAETLVRKTVKN